MRNPTTYLPIYLIAGTQDIVEGTLPELLEQALQAGITCFQLREKGLGSLEDSKSRRSLAIDCQKLCRSYDVPFIINDDVALALDIGADGVHVGQDDQAIDEVLGLFPNKIVGLSCYDEKEIELANQLVGISYYGIGPVFGTISKADAKPPIGVERLAELAKRSKRPAVAIGGISTENFKEIQTTTVAGCAVISAITRSADLTDTIKRLTIGG
ncbi:thiamine phosphate synthase [Candidatus Enterococcus clewellii]|uniref:Thiamine-phosphate synthase n=1 Tax=Candidatus Enterococcus clewellii TaxID=1834193 RepID=A0A242K7C9_9ENTE|nr:thiamine phosphate synthase [Enterococcus sp. 9E7_DIV0242]OTP16114.1 thiamine-phosphate pyrophosphorylase [Enterococcus sp. 9E7_DIV0242]